MMPIMSFWGKTDNVRFTHSVASAPVLNNKSVTVPELRSITVILKSQ